MNGKKHTSYQVDKILYLLGKNYCNPNPFFKGTFKYIALFTVADTPHSTIHS